MLEPAAIPAYRGPSLWRGRTFVYLPPHPLLRPWVSCYTLTCPAPSGMTDAYTVLPTASSTLVYAVGSDGVYGGLRGVNTVPVNVGAFANRHRLLLLIEFRPGGLYPFVPVGQQELRDGAFAFASLDRALDRAVLEALGRSVTVRELADRLDALLLTHRGDRETSPQLRAALERVIFSGGEVEVRTLARELSYSERQLGRIFRTQLGAGVKTFSRIVRVNRVLQLLQDPNPSLTAVAAVAGYFDQSHSIRDFRAVCGMTPGEYRRHMSVLYNDAFKL